MINYGEDVFRIFIALANQIRLIYQVKVLRNYSNEEIASLLNLKNPKQVMAIRYKIDKYKESSLLSKEWGMEKTFQNFSRVSNLI